MGQESWPIVNCGALRAPNRTGGYSNFMTHIRTQHPQHLQEISTACTFKNIAVTLVDKASANLYGWMIQIVMDNIAFSYVERKHSRAYSKLKPITRRTLMKYLVLVYEQVKQIISKQSTIPIWINF